MKAKEMFQRALSGYLKLKGPDHPITMGILRDLDSLEEVS